MSRTKHHHHRQWAPWRDPSWFRKGLNRTFRRVSKYLVKVGREVNHWKRNRGWYW